MNDHTTNLVADEIRYHALVGVSNAVASQPDLQGVLHSVSNLLSRLIGFDSVGLLVLNEGGERARLFALESELRGPAMLVGHDFSVKDTSLALALKEQKPIYIPHLSEEIAKIPGLTRSARIEPQTSAYVFPVSSARKQMGLLIFSTSAGGNYSAQDIELMRSVTIHIATLLEATLALEAAEAYKLTLARERDRLKLLLDINNLTITHLEMSAHFRAASKSIHAFFDNAFTGFWLFEEGSNQLELMSLDFPRGVGFVENMRTSRLRENDVAKMRTRTAAVLGPEEIGHLPESIARSIGNNSIVSMLCVPLVGTKGPLGILSLGSLDKDAFTQDDIDML